MLELDREELAWAAGLFDGEGHIRSHRHSSNVRGQHLELNVVQNNDSWAFAPEMLYRLEELFKVGTVCGPYDNKLSQNWKWIITNFHHCQFVIGLMWFKLSDVKKDQAAKALRAYTLAYPHDYHAKRKKLS
jgi:hypothetical protein